MRIRIMHAHVGSVAQHILHHSYFIDLPAGYDKYGYNKEGYDKYGECSIDTSRLI
jgi:hypothetical protein